MKGNFLVVCMMAMTLVVCIKAHVFGQNEMPLNQYSRVAKIMMRITTGLYPYYLTLTEFLKRSCTTE